MRSQIERKLTEEMLAGLTHTEVDYIAYAEYTNNYYVITAPFELLSKTWKMASDSYSKTDNRIYYDIATAILFTTDKDENGQWKVGFNAKETDVVMMYLGEIALEYQREIISAYKDYDYKAIEKYGNLLLNALCLRYMLNELRANGKAHQFDFIIDPVTQKLENTLDIMYTVSVYADVQLSNSAKYKEE